MSTLDVPGARLHYQVRGNGPLFVMVPASGGDGDIFDAVADELASRYRVATYDRRGFSRSRLHGRQDYARRLATDADDVSHLVEHLADGPATIFGNSSGAVVALEVHVRHPDVVATTIAHEPPAVRLLPDGEEWVSFFEEVYDLYRAAGIHVALEHFANRIAHGSEIDMMQKAMDPNNGSKVAANVTYWFERELRQYTKVLPDVEALARGADRLVLVGGRESKQQVCYRPNEVLGARFGLEVVDLPGGHVGFLTHPGEFARELLLALDRGTRPSPEVAGASTHVLHHDQLKNGGTK
ncbi:alpha/beta hydrolase [Spongiactinospora sp. 9N601]|uniref:alpha/beta hydrolase n=1 Tax=Spongiactinospora sp. 9N601 TaxID=3375149 RepID=UPI0037A489A7